MITHKNQCYAVYAFLFWNEHGIEKSRTGCMQLNTNETSQNNKFREKENKKDRSALIPVQNMSVEYGSTWQDI